MSQAPPSRSYLNVVELSAQTGMSAATIHRLKRAGKIPFLQPAGKGGRLLFPLDALEQAGTGCNSEPAAPAVNETKNQLAGPRPAWMQGRAKS